MVEWAGLANDRSSGKTELGWGTSLSLGLSGRAKGEVLRLMGCVEYMVGIGGVLGVTVVGILMFILHIYSS